MCRRYGSRDVSGSSLFWMSKENGSCVRITGWEKKEADAFTRGKRIPSWQGFLPAGNRSTQRIGFEEAVIICSLRDFRPVSGF